MSDKRSARDKAKAHRQPRASITFPPKLYRLLESLAKEKKVSIAWVVREAAEKYVAGQAAQTEVSAKGGQA
jgi:predicted DNA-binding protein